MSNNIPLKFLYETSISKEVEEKVTETQEQNGEKVEVTKTVKVNKPVKLAILKPNRKLYEGSEKFYAIQMAEFIRAGLLPYSLVAKRYANDGGPLNDSEKTHLVTLRSKANDLEARYFAISGDSDKTEERNSLLLEINKINTEIGNIQNAYADIYENTAEVKSRNKTIEWWVLHLAYIEDEKGYRPIFGEGDHIAKLEAYYKIDDLEDTFLNACIRKISFLISFWFASTSNLSKIEFESMDKLYDNEVSK